ncbi:MAG: RNA polymerase sigma-70 factor [Bacteroidaceae bacterium]|nr:RNA polymerase sigma-70 factor [Bacteroidaceae bacterium]
MHNELIKRLKAGDQTAFKHIFDEHYVLLCGFANQFLNNKPLSEEIVDDVIFYLWEHRDTLEITYSIRAYLMRSVRNRCMNELNSRSIRTIKETRSQLSCDNWEFLEIVCSENNNPLHILLEHELIDKLHLSIENLPLESRQVFKKSRFELKKNEEIALELGISINTVKYHIKRALAILRKDLTDYLTIVLFYIFTGK